MSLEKLKIRSTCKVVVIREEETVPPCSSLVFITRFY